MSKDDKPNSPFKLSLLIGGAIALMWAAIFVVAPPSKVAEQVLSAERLQQRANERDIEAWLHELSNNLNAQLPRLVDQDVRLDTTFAGPGNRFSYIYTMLRQRK